MFKNRNLSLKSKSKSKTGTKSEAKNKRLTLRFFFTMAMWGTDWPCLQWFAIFKDAVKERQDMGWFLIT